MRQTFFVRLVLLNTFKKRLRATLVVGGIAITSSVMICLFGISIGLKQMVTNELSSSQASDVVTVDQRNVQQIKFDQERVSKVQSVTGVGELESSVGLVGDVTYHGIDLSIPVYGITPNYFSVTEARFTGGQGTDLHGTNAIVSSKVLSAFGISSGDAIGKQITATVAITRDYAAGQTDQQITTAVQTFTIAGVIDKGTAPVAYLPMDYLQTNGLTSVGQLRVRLSSPDRMVEVREAIEQMGFQTSSIQDTVDQINKVFTVIQKTLVLFGFIVLAITVSGTFTIISLTLMEEMQQIGYLRISGLRNRDVTMLFILQSILLTSLGALCGVLGGLFGGVVVDHLAKNAAAGTAFQGPITIFAVPTTQIVLVLVLSVFVGWAVGLFPARRAVIMRPLDELAA